jgi:hypothetical protein
LNILWKSEIEIPAKLTIVRPTIALAAVAALAVAAACASVVPPYDLECEARRNPVGIDTPQPRYSWKLLAEPQAAYQIPVGASSDVTDLWDSLRTASTETAWIAYAGPKLESFRRYRWRVRVWNTAGEVSPWTDFAEWTQAPADSHGWKGAWRGQEPPGGVQEPDRLLSGTTVGASTSPGFPAGSPEAARDSMKSSPCGIKEYHH